MRGVIRRSFTVNCGICEEKLTKEFNSIGLFEDSISEKWRVTQDHGWIHRHCLKQLPTDYQVRQMLKKANL